MPQVLGVLLVVSSMEVSTGCPKYWGLGVLLVVSSMEVSTGCPKYRGVQQGISSRGGGSTGCPK